MSPFRMAHRCRRCHGRDRLQAFSRLGLESLEPRQLLAARPVISEFLSSNRGGLNDGDGESPDWIEIFNAGDSAVDLGGYRMTDDAEDLSKWVLPSGSLPPGGFLVVFASGEATDDYVDPEGHLHTNFALKREGDYLALVAPDGTVVSEFGEDGAGYPPQLTNVSYGAAQSLTLVDANREASYLVPLDGSLGARWTEADFDANAHGFATATASMGFETQPDAGTNFNGHFQTALPEGSHGVYARMEFDLNDAAAISSLQLRLKYDDGFVAYLNGAKVLQENAPPRVGWFSTAPSGSRPDKEALEFVDYSLDQYLPALLDGRNVLAIHLLNNISDTSDILLVAELHAGASDLLAATGQPAKVGYMVTPTPGAPNVATGKVFSGFVADTQFSVDRGFYTQPFQVEITTETPAAEIRYTTDGSQPTRTRGVLYTGPITVNTTTTLRAAAYRDDYVASNVDTQTYLFLEDVIAQGNTPEGYPTQWGDGSPSDYEMDPEITQSPAYRDVMDDALRSIPSVSIVTDIGNLFDPDTGIYMNTENHGLRWEKPASVELLVPDGTKGFQQNVGLRIQGGASRTPRMPKHGFRLLFKSEYGDSKLRYPLFGNDAVDQFDAIILRAGSNQSWVHTNTWMGDNRGRAQYIRDQWAKDTQRAMGHASPHNRYVHLYVNGIYWGLYTAGERPNASWAASYFGGNKEDYEVINGGMVIDGDANTTRAFRDLFRQADAGLAEDAQYQAFSELLDIDAFIDYMILNQYGGNRDWDTHNWYLVRRREPAGKYRFVTWDTEFIFINNNDNVLALNANLSPGRLFRQLAENDEFRMRLADRIQQHFSHDGVLTPESVVRRWEIRSNQVFDAMVAESARWGDYRRDVNPTGTPLVLLQRDVQWTAERNRLLNEYFPQRTDIVLQQYRRAGLFPSMDAPVFSRHGGVVSPAFPVTLSAPEGTIYFTTDGSDPRLRGGAVSPDAQRFTEPQIIARDTTIKARVLHDGHWSALSEAAFIVASQLPLRVTEINYHPHQANLVAGLGEEDVDGDRFEFIELTNIGNTALNLEGVQFVPREVDGDRQGVRFVFAEQTLAASERMVVVHDREAFQSRYGNQVRIAAGDDGDGGESGEFGGQLDDVGEQLTLLDASGQLIQQFRYATSGAWPRRAAGRGSSLQVVDTQRDYRDPENWRASRQFGGSPGATGRGPGDTVVINEILANSDAAGGDLIELYNATGQHIDITGWYLSDTESEFAQSAVESATVVPALGYHVLHGAELGLDLDGERGDELWLIAADRNGKPLRFVDHVQFGTSARGQSMGPWPARGGDWVTLAEPTWGGANTGPRVGEIVISEIHHSPLDPDGDQQLRADDFEFIELYNRTDEPMDVAGWQLTGSAAYTFPDGTVIDGGHPLIVVGFKPSRTGKATIFRFLMGAGEAPLAGSYRDPLGDTGLIQLVRPGQPPADDPRLAPMLLVDEVRYGADAPWPATASGGGDSLTRTRPSDYGNFPTSWMGRSPSPGAVDFVLRQPGDANGDGHFDPLDIALVQQSGKYLTRQPAVWSEGDWTGDGRFDQFDVVAALQQRG